MAIKQLFRATASSFAANANGFSQPSRPMRITHHGQHKDGTLWIRLTDGNFRNCRIDRVANEVEVAYLEAAIEYAFENKLPVILRAKGNNSTSKWFCEVTFVAYDEVARACPLTAIGTSFA